METFFAVVLILVLAVLIPVVVALRNKLNTLSGKVAELRLDLEGEIRELKSELHLPERPPAPVLEDRQTEKEALPVAPAPPQAAAPPRPAPVVSKPRPLPSPPSRTRAEWETLIGGQWLNRIGALALVIGTGFFLKYAFDNDWITESLRVLIGLIAGAALLLGGARARKKGFQIFAQGLAGAGIPVLYLSVYASFNFYHLVPQIVAFGAMAAVTILAFHQAFKYDSLAVSLLGWAGGFLTPFLLSTGQANEVGLFTYIALLVAGLLAVLSRKGAWVVLEVLTLGATYLIYLLWNQEYYTPDDLLVTVLFLSVFWGLFWALDFSRVGRPATAFAAIRQGVAAFNAIFYYAAMYALINPDHPEWMGGITLAIGMFYFLTALAVRQRRAEHAMAFARYILTAIALLVLATAIQFSGFITVVGWALEALMLFWCGIHWNQRYAWRAGLFLFGLAALKLFFTEGALSWVRIEEFALLLNQRALAFAVLAAGLGAAAVLGKGMEEKSRALIREMLHYGWCILVFIGLTVEINDWFRQLINATEGATAGLEFKWGMTMALVWMAGSLPLVWGGRRQNALPVLYSGLGALFLSVVLAGGQGITFTPIAKFTPLMNFRAFVLVFVLAGMWAHARWLKKSCRAYEWISSVLWVLQIGLALLVLELISVETRDFFERAIYLAKQKAGSVDVAGELKRLANIEQLALSGTWLLYSIVLMGLGIWRRTPELRLVALFLFGATILKMFAYDLSFLETLYRIFSFIGLGVILLAVSYLYQRYKAVIFIGESEQK